MIWTLPRSQRYLGKVKAGRILGLSLYFIKKHLPLPDKQ
jgi:hypothetical protein